MTSPSAAPRSIPCYQIDAFAARPFEGNPAAVCPLTAWLDDALMQQIASENNLSETAFFVPRGDAFDLRWFTPESEIDLCGHATLAAAFLLMTELEPSRQQVTFGSKSGPLPVCRDGDAFVLDFPARPGHRVAHPPAALLKGLGAPPREVWLARDYMAVYDDEEVVQRARPNMDELASLTEALGVIITAPASDPPVDFVSRFFVPSEGIPEDPVTGSAHCTLAPYWAARFGRKQLHARQVSRRGGSLGCTVEGDRVHLAGQAVLVKSGVFHLFGEANAV